MRARRAPDRPGVAPTLSGRSGLSGAQRAQWTQLAHWARFFGRGYDSRSRQNLSVVTASTLTPGQAGDDRL